MTPSTTSDLFERIRFRGQPFAHPDSMVVSGNARFTLLTPRLIRLEWSETGRFEDRSTFAFPNRYAPPPAFVTRTEGQTLVIDTGALTVRYRKNSGPFTADNLAIAFDLNGRRQVWVPGTPNPLNLRGTRRTLDLCEGDAALDEGLLSRAGWALFDDSRSVVFDGWPQPRPDHPLQDWYFFGYGHDYKGALADYTRFGGPIPLIPRFVLGAWWSRYWAYSAQDLQDLVSDFAAYGLPLDVLVVDMDWHTPHAWTGYTWNRELFPDPPAFLRWVHERGLRVTLNLHPAQGVQPFEEVYPRFAQAMGVDPASGQAIPFRITDPRFVQNYFELLHHPLEEDGVDFWWLDWQQGNRSEMPGLDPLPWLNHLHFHDSTRRGRRPMLYSRWGGLGNHRYGVGFSGDTVVGWTALQFQPYFTATAANVAFGWWSHDIGGHMGGATEPELYVRWVQFGALSPCLRLHGTKDPRTERRPWKYPDEAFQATRDAFRWRYQLVPYLYTLARIASDTGLAPCRPLYYEYPEEEAAYSARNQYFLGDQIIAAPILQPANPDTGLAAADVWIPPGTWIEYTTKEMFTGPRWVRLVGDLARMPMLMPAGAILPLAPPLTSGTTDRLPRDRLILAIFPGESGSFRLYEDDGITDAYRQGQCEWTPITMQMPNPETWEVHIAAVEGHCDTLPNHRGYEIRLEGSRRPDRVTLNGAEIAAWSYDAETLRTIIHVPQHPKSQPVQVVATATGGMSALGQAHNRSLIRADVQRLLGPQCPATEDVPAFLDAVLRSNAPGRLDAVARLGGPFVHLVEFSTPEEAALHLGQAIVAAPAGDDPYDLELTWTLTRGSTTEQQTVRLTEAREPQILDSPFAFDGQVQTARWSAQARLTWHGVTLVYTHLSRLLFPSISAWRALFYDEAQNPLSLAQVMATDGTIHSALPWQPFVQTLDGLINVNRPHYLAFSLIPGLEVRTSLAAYLATTIRCPTQRPARIHFHAAGPVEFYLNGQPLAEIPSEPEEGIPPLFRRPRQTVTASLRAGGNSLIALTRPSQEEHPIWFFEAKVTTPDGEAMLDLAFE